MHPPITPILLAGGAGTRLWPLSRDSFPKQFLPLLNDRSTFQEALLRVQGPDFTRPIVVTGPECRFFAARQAEELGIDASVVIEPERRDSAPAIAAAVKIASAANPSALILALAADHVILDREAFRDACIAGIDAAKAGLIVTFGIKPHEPRTSYGYILPGSPVGTGVARKVTRFAEKPDASTAVQYVSQGYLWNSGNLLFRADVLLAELAKFEPRMAEAVNSSVAQSTKDLNFFRLGVHEFSAAPQKSIDYAVMERTEKAAVICGNFRWSDIGSWDALFDVSPHDKDGNVVHGSAVALGARNCLVHSDHLLTALIGVDDLVVITTPDAVLVVPRARSQDVREMVALLKKGKRTEATAHRRVHRPWGYYDSVDAGARFQVKRIVVNAGGMLSLQKHQHRAEHWVVVRGTAEVTIGDTVKSVYENESIYIPIGSVHRLSNKGHIPLELIEVQTGSYLGEDDIVRIDDVYRRSPPG